VVSNLDIDMYNLENDSIETFQMPKRVHHADDQVQTNPYEGLSSLKEQVQSKFFSTYMLVAWSFFQC
jgi:hypothetical protein